MHISGTSDIDVFSEEFEYLTGEIGQSMFPYAKHFLCEHCRKEFIKDFKGEEFNNISGELDNTQHLPIYKRLKIHILLLRLLRTEGRIIGA